MELKRYENQGNVVNTGLLKEDEYSFFVLAKILEDENRLTITDNSRLIICHSCPPYPVWVWMPDDATNEELERAWQLIKENFSFNEGYDFNVKYAFAEYMLKRAEEENICLEIKVHMYAYNCPNLIKPEKTLMGSVCFATEEDFEDVLLLMKGFHRDTFHRNTDTDNGDDSHHRSRAETLIQKKSLLLWKNEKGENVAMCSYSINGNLGSSTSVFTKNTERRKGYALNLVYHVTKLIAEQGKMPMLYTDAEYEASNACYRKLGYELQGRVCTVGKVS